MDLQVVILAFRQGSAAVGATMVGSSLMILVIWLAVRMAMIGYVSWMQPAFATIVLLEPALGWTLPAPSRA